MIYFNGRGMEMPCSWLSLDLVAREKSLELVLRFWYW